MGNLYNTIMELCSQRGITGYRLCKDIGIQPSIMTDLKSGRKKGLSAKVANKVASYFEVSVGYLLGSEDNEKLVTDSDNELSPEEYEIILQFRSASEAKRQAIELILKDR